MKKFILAFILSCLFCSSADAATRTWDGGGGDNLASTDDNWSDNTEPVAGDTVVFDGTNAKNCTFDLTADFASLNTTGYGGVVTASATITVSGNVTFANGTFAHGNQKLVIDSTCTLNTGNNSLYNLSGNLSDTETITLGANVTVTNDWDINEVSDNAAWAGAFTIYVGRNVLESAATDYSVDANGGTDVTLEFNGTGSQSFTMDTYGDATYKFWPNIVINKGAGTLTFVGKANFAGDWTYQQGTVDMGTFMFRINDTMTINDATTNFYDMWAVLANKTVTLSGNVKVTNSLDLNYASDNATYNGNKFMVSGDLKATTVYRVEGTTDIEFTGAGTQTWTSSAGSSSEATYKGILNDIIINKSGGSLTLSGTIRYATGTLTFTAGVVDAGTSLLKLTDSCNLDIDGMSLWDMTVERNTTTLLGNLDVNDDLILTGAGDTLDASSYTVTIGDDFTNGGTFTKGTSTVDFDGNTTHAIDGSTDFYSLTCSASDTCTFDDADTFTVAAAGTFTLAGTVNSDSAGNQATLNLTSGATQTITPATAVCTDVDSSGGDTVYNIGGTNSNCTNWVDHRTYSMAW